MAEKTDFSRDRTGTSDFVLVKAYKMHISAVLKGVIPLKLAAVRSRIFSL